MSQTAQAERAQKGTGRILEEFQNEEAVRIALNQGDDSALALSEEERQQSLAQSSRHRLNTERIEYSDDWRIGDADYKNKSLSPKPEDHLLCAAQVAQEIGLDCENVLLASFAEQLKLEEEADEAVKDLGREQITLNGNASALEEMKDDGQGSETLLDPEFEGLGNLSALPLNLVEDTLAYLDQDSLDMLKLLNHNWRNFMQSERIWRRFCDRIYVKPAFRPVQCRAGALPRQFASWYEAGQKRPRVRVDTGVYILRHMYFRDPGPRTPWTKAEDYKPFLDCRHYRYFLFKPTGELLYCSTPLAPHLMRPKFIRKLKEDYVQEGLVRRVREGGEDEDEADGKDSGENAESPPAPKPLTKRERAMLRAAARREKVDVTKADVIHRGFYTVLGKKLTTVMNLGNFSVTFTFEIIESHLFEIVSHSSVYHNANAVVQHYEVPRFRPDRIFEYYSFRLPPSDWIDSDP